MGWLRGVLFGAIAVSSLCATSSDILISAEDAMKLIGQEKVMFVTGDDEDIYATGHIKGSVEMYAHHLHHSSITSEARESIMIPW